MSEMQGVPFYAVAQSAEGIGGTMPKMRPRLHYFKQANCAQCEAAKRVVDALRSEGVAVTTHDIGEVEGLAEATFYGVLATPTIVLEAGERELGRWNGNITAERIKSKFEKAGTRA